ncbi:MAG: hypothetical protein AB1468_06910, partial [Candidatus Micrarchaeota archaeon]
LLALMIMERGNTIIHEGKTTEQLVRESERESYATILAKAMLKKLDEEKNPLAISSDGFKDPPVDRANYMKAVRRTELGTQLMGSAHFHNRPRKNIL